MKTYSNFLIVLLLSFVLVSCGSPAAGPVAGGEEGGEEGGEIVATGTPEQIAQNPASHTGRYLRDVLATGRSNAYAN